MGPLISGPCSVWKMKYDIKSPSFRNQWFLPFCHCSPWILKCLCFFYSLLNPSLHITEPLLHNIVVNIQVKALRLQFPVESVVCHINILQHVSQGYESLFCFKKVGLCKYSWAFPAVVSRPMLFFHQTIQGHNSKWLYGEHLQPLALTVVVVHKTIFCAV